MKKICYELDPVDAPIVASMRAATAAQKGKFVGVAAREPFRAQKRAVPAAPDVVMEPGVVSGVPGWWCRPTDARPDVTLLYLHGGWYMLGDAESFCNQASHYAARTKAATFVADYRLAPEAPFPAAYDDAVAVYSGLADRGPGRIALVGDSVGGALALLVLATAAPWNDGKLAGAVAMSPVADLTLGGESMDTRADADPIFSRDMVARFVDAYLAGGNARDPRASPLFGQLGNLPPIRIDVGDDEILLDDAVRYAARADVAGVDVTLGIWSGMPHVFQGMVGRLQAAVWAIEAEADFLNRVLEPS